MNDAADTKIKTRDVAHRWTPALAKLGWTPVSDYFIDNYHRLDLKYAEAMFVIHLMRHKWDSNAPYPGFKSIAKRMGISPQAARIHARSLQKKGYLVREMQVGNTNRFHLDKLFAALEAIAKHDAKEKADGKTKQPKRTPETEAQRKEAMIETFRQEAAAKTLLKVGVKKADLGTPATV